MLSDLLTDFGTKIDLAVLLEVSEDTVRTRLLERAAVEGRHDDTAATIGHRLEVYKTENMPLIDHYRQLGVLKSIDGSWKPEDVSDSVLTTLDDVVAGKYKQNSN